MGSGGGGGFRPPHLSVRGKIGLCLFAVAASLLLVDINLYSQHSEHHLPSGAPSASGAVNPVRLPVMDGSVALNRGERFEGAEPMDGGISSRSSRSTSRSDASSAAATDTRNSRRRRRPIWMPCYNETEAERLRIQQWRSSRPKGMSTKEDEKTARCWHKRTKSDPLLPSEELPPTGPLAMRMDVQWLRDLLFVHQKNFKRLGKGFSDDEGGTLLDSPEAIRFLPETGEEALEGVRLGDCAVVGSGGSLHGSRQGRAIDKHEAVLRVNEAPVEGFAVDVGQRTQIRLINNLWSDNYSRGASASRPLEQNVTLISTRADGDAFMNLGKWTSRKRPDVQLRLMSSRVVTAVRKGVLIPWRKLLNESGVDVLEAAVLEGRDTPSSGLVATFLLVQLCDKVTVYGFNGINDGSRYHYWKTARRYQNRTHSFTAERALLRALDRDGIVRFVDGNLELIRTWV